MPHISLVSRERVSSQNNKARRCFGWFPGAKPKFTSQRRYNHCVPVVGIQISRLVGLTTTTTASWNLPLLPYPRLTLPLMKWVVNLYSRNSALGCQVFLQRCELTDFHVRSFRVDYTTTFSKSSNVIGNSQYCSCSSACIALVPQKGSVCSDLSKKPARHVAQQKQSSPPVAFTFLHGSLKELSFLVVADPIHIQAALVSASTSVLPFAMQQWQKCTVERVQQARWLAQKANSVPQRGEAAEALTAISMTKGQAFRIDIYFGS